MEHSDHSEGDVESSDEDSSERDQDDEIDQGDEYYDEEDDFDEDQGTSHFIYWATKGNLENVRKELLQEGVRVNKRDSDGNTALICACEKGHLNVVKELLKGEGIQVNVKNELEETALITAAKGCRFKIVVELLKHKKVKINETAIYEICSLWNGNLGGFKEGMKQKFNTKDSLFTLLKAKYSSEDAYEGAKDAEGEDDDAELIVKDAMIKAIEKGRLDVVRRLLTFQLVDLSARNSNDTTYLIFASTWGYSNIVSELLEQPTILNLIDAVNSDGDTALMKAIGTGYFDIVDNLLKKDADVNINNEANETALILATRDDRPDFVDILLNHKADTAVKDKDGNTVLMVACIESGVQTVATLLKNKQILKSVNSNKNNKRGFRALTLAWKKCKFENVNELLKHKEVDASVVTADIMNITNDDGCTALIWASWKGDLAFVKRLLKLDIDEDFCNATDSSGYTALMTACYYGHLDIVEKLCEKKEVDIAVETQDGENNETALSISKDNRNDADSDDEHEKYQTMMNCLEKRRKKNEGQEDGLFDKLKAKLSKKKKKY